MSVAPAPARSPLGRLALAEREQAIAALRKRLTARDADDVLAALAGSDEDIGTLPTALRARAQRAILAGLPKGVNAIVASELGIVSVPVESWLPGLRARHDGMRVDDVAVQHQAQLTRLAQALAESSDDEAPDPPTRHEEFEILRAVAYLVLLLAVSVLWPGERPAKLQALKRRTLARITRRAA